MSETWRSVVRWRWGLLGGTRPGSMRCRKRTKGEHLRRPQWTGLDRLEPRLLMDATVDLEPAPGTGTITEENGTTVVTLDDGGVSIDFTAKVLTSDELLNLFAFNFEASDNGPGQLTLRDWVTNVAAGWIEDDGDISDDEVAALAAGLVAPVDLGTFVVDVPPDAVGEFRVSIGPEGNSSLFTGGFPPTTPVPITSFGEALIRVGQVGQVPEVTIEATDFLADEQGPDTGFFVVSRTGDTADPLNVNLIIDDSSAQNGVDFDAITNVVTIPAGADSIGFIIRPVDDALTEGLESIAVIVTNGQGYTIGAMNTDTVNINDNDAAVMTVTLDQTPIDNQQAQAISFGDATIDLPGPILDFVVGNDGYVPLQLDSLTLPVGFTAVTAFVPASIDPGLSQTFSVQLDTDTIGVAMGTMSFANNDSDNNPFAFFIIGNVTDVIAQADFDDEQLPADSQVNGAFDFVEVEPGAGDFALALLEASDSTFIRTLDLPDNTGTLEFDFRFINASAGDSLRVLVNGIDQLVQPIDGAGFAGDDFVAIPPVDIAEFRGLNNVQISIMLDSADPATGQLQIDNVRIITSTDVEVPFADKDGHSHTYTDASGEQVTISIRGPGTGTLVFRDDPQDVPNQDAKELILSDTSTKTSVTIKTDRKGDGTSIERVTVESANSLRSFRAMTTDLGSAFTSPGPVGELIMRDVLAGVTIISLGGDDDARPSRIGFRHITGLNFQSSAQIRDFRVAQWDSDAAVVDRLKGTAVASLSTTGIRGDDIVNGSFNANIELEGAVGARMTLGRMKIADGVNNADFEFAGDIGTTDIRGQTNNLNFTVNSNARSVKFAVANNVNIDLGDDGVLRSATFEQWNVGSLNAASVSNLSVRGNRRDAIEGNMTGVTINLMLPFAPRASAFRSIRVTNLIDSSEIRTLADGGSVDARGSFTNSAIYIGAKEDGEVGPFPTSGDAPAFFFQSPTTLKSARLGSFDDSIIAAHQIRRADLGDLALNNAGGDRYGLTGDLIGQLRADSNGTKISLRNVDDTQTAIDELLAEGIDLAAVDFVIELF